MSDEKPVAEKRDPDASAPDLDALDSSWDDDELDEDATTVAKIPKDLIALARMKDHEPPPKEEAPPEKHEAITARPPPLANGEGGAVNAPHTEPLVVVDAPHEKLAAADRDEADDEEDEEEEESDAAEGDEEARARAADEAAGLDEAARRKAADERAQARREKARTKTLAARERRKAKVEAQRAKQKQKKKRSIPPRAPNDDAPVLDAAPTSRERPTGRPAAPDAAVVKGAGALAPRRDWVRMALLCAIVVIIGALIIGLARR